MDLKWELAAMFPSTNDTSSKRAPSLDDRSARRPARPLPARKPKNLPNVQASDRWWDAFTSLP